MSGLSRVQAPEPTLVCTQGSAKGLAKGDGIHIVLGEMKLQSRVGVFRVGGACPTWRVHGLVQEWVGFFSGLVGGASPTRPCPGVGLGCRQGPSSWSTNLEFTLLTGCTLV